MNNLCGCGFQENGSQVEVYTVEKAKPGREAEVSSLLSSEFQLNLASLHAYLSYVDFLELVLNLGNHTSFEVCFCSLVLQGERKENPWLS